MQPFEDPYGELKKLTDQRREARNARDLDRITVLTAAINRKLDEINRAKAGAS